jgi:two-component system OmpR family sensor kinase
MATDRLTRQELSWLLAQEARAAASMLRKGVSGLKIEEAPASAEVSSTLDALDDAVKTLASLQTGSTAHSRRGRIDVAALLLELAPHAALSLEPGSGTEIFADEAELRRTFQVLLSMGAPTGEDGSSITVRHEGDQIRVEVELGPDSSAVSSLEKAWLHRMAVRHGGQLMFEGHLVALGLPAGAEKRELDELRRELAAAQEQGEMYAREIATMFAQKGQDDGPPKASPGPTLPSLCGALASLLRPELLALRDEMKPATSPRLQGLIPLVDALDRFARAETERSAVDLGKALQNTASAHQARAERRKVVLLGEAPSATIQANPEALGLLLDLLFTQAIEASPASTTVVFALTPGNNGFSLDDRGTAVPADARQPLLELRQDPCALGRPHGIQLGLAAALAAAQGASLLLDDAPGGGLRASVIF